MRADRLISLLLLLQRRGRMTAEQLAAELGVSERTIYRDIDALSISGMPVYADRGPEGGFSLLEAVRVDWSDLTDSELRAIFLLTIPRAVADLGLDKALASALLKTRASISARGLDEEVRMRERVFLDPESWEPESTSPFLSVLHIAALEDRCANISYRLPSGAEVKQLVDVYGLVAKEDEWYVVYALAAEREARASEANALASGTKQAARRRGKVRKSATPASESGEPTWRALPVASLVDARLSRVFPRRFDFDLVRVWRDWCREYPPPPFEFTLLASEGAVPRLGAYGIAVQELDEETPDREGRVRVRATCESFQAARSRVLALGRAVEVVGPEPLRRSVVDFAEQILARYGAPAGTGG